MPGDREDVLVGDGVAEAFAGSLDSAKALVAVVSSLFNGKKDQHAHIVVNANGGASSFPCARSGVGCLTTGVLPGVRISVENQAKSLHAVAYVKPAMFTSFTYYGDPDHMDSDGGDEEGESAGVVNASTQFRVNLASLLDCLTVFGACCPHVSCAIAHTRCSCFDESRLFGSRRNVLAHRLCTVLAYSAPDARGGRRAN